MLTNCLCGGSTDDDWDNAPPAKNENGTAKAKAKSSLRVVNGDLLA
jgi:hypothetical protein